MHPPQHSAATRKKLPTNLDTWRLPGYTKDDEEKIWAVLDEVFRERGVVLWRSTNSKATCTLVPPDAHVVSNGFSYVTNSRERDDGLGTSRRIQPYSTWNPLTRIGRTEDGRDFAIRVIVIGNEGHDHLRILRKLATGPVSLISENHTLPMEAEFAFEDIIFGFFPKVGAPMDEAFGYWAQNSVGDVLDMIMQALEGLAFIHDLNIAHRDAFISNFLVQWYPESIRAGHQSVSRPRVYLIDFETAQEYPPDQPRMTGYPLCSSFPDIATYSRPRAPEMLTPEKHYCPFKLDIWQFGSSLENFQSTFTEVDTILAELVCEDPVSRLSASEALNKLVSTVHAIPPVSLLILPPKGTIKNHS
ncbi:hypothetical protein ARMSODRAFT_794958 [Armillaria solidipes]|uniref:Protein kinase domain-containing protein n=1 Tax=Armillaria solidipes TaxID=1076256 RepID=A0A2H3BLZ1_9AGAR|nr:hypothetical protein ARMSODRAFT_794958 [Armillaria solidipes]